MNYKDVERGAKKGKLETCQGKGSHRIVKGPAGRGYMVYPCHDAKDYGPGLACKIKKWFAELGIILTLIGCTYLAWLAVTL